MAALIALFTAATIQSIMGLSSDYAKEDSPTINKIPMKEVLDSLFVKNGYDKRIRPGLDEGLPVNVTINYKIISIMNVDDVNMDFKVTMYFRHMWTDSRLRHNYGGHILLEPDSLPLVWQPDLTFPDDKMGETLMHNDYNSMIKLEEDGTVFKSVRQNLQLTCDMMMERYPMDTQTCYIRVESYGHSSESLILSWTRADGMMDVSDLEVPMFYITGGEIKDSIVLYALGNLSLGYFYQNSYEIKFERKYIGHIINIYIPSVLIVGMSWVAFHIDSKYVTPRISVGLLTVLTMTTFTSRILSDLPMVTYIRAVDIWILACLVTVFCAFLQTVVVIVLRGQDIPDTDVGQLAKPADVNSKCGSISTCHSRSQAVDRTCRVIFPLLFTVFAGGYFTNYLVY